MMGCPSREQLADLVAERTIESDGLAIDTHARSCPMCRAILDSMAQDETTDTGRSENSAGAAQYAVFSDDDANSLADPGATVETVAPAPEPANSLDVVSLSVDDSSSFETIETAVGGPAGKGPSRVTDEVLPSPAESSSETIDTAIRAPIDPSSMQTVEDTSRPALWAADRASRSEARAPVAFDSSAKTQHATLEVSSSSMNEATLDFSEHGQSIAKKTVADSSTRPNRSGKKGPADYEILGELGRGGMGIVYKALDRRLNRIVALKMIRGAVDADDIQVTRFRIEAEAVAALRHPNILQIYDIGESDGLPYVALELLEGGSLAEKLKGTPLPPRKAAEWMVPMAMAMDTAHKAGIVHRDLKSVNILFTADDVPKVTDFGLAKRLDVDEGHTHTGQVMGTPSYMAPEQARGDTKKVGPPADIYALGAILYEMLTGRPPFKGVSAMDTVKLVIEVEPVAPSRVQYKVPRDLETICLKCLQKEPRKRYATAKEMADDLHRHLLGEPIRARRTPPVERAIKWTKRHPTVALASLCAIVGLMSLAGYGAWYWNHLRVLERTALQHDASVKKETTDDLFRAQEAVSRNDLAKAHEILTSRIELLTLEHSKSPELAELVDRAKTKIGEIESAQSAELTRQTEQRARDEVQRRYRQFVDRRDETLFRDTKFTGVVGPTNLELTRKAAQEALGVFGTAGGDGSWTVGALPASLSAEQQTDVKEGCYEMLLVLAGTMVADGPEKADRALMLLESAGRLRPGHSRAFHLNKAACLALKKDKDGEARELAEAQRLRPETAFDFFLTGQQEYKDKQYPDAIRHFESALRQAPGHFWAKCLQGICYIQTKEFKAAKSSFNGCLQTSRDFPWLYLLRAFACGELGARYLELVKTSPGHESDLQKSVDQEFGEAEQDIHEALALLKSTPNLDLEYTLLVNRGLVRFRRGRFDQAVADYKAAIRLKADEFEAHGNLARVYEKSGRPDLAIDEFTRAIALKPGWSPLYRGRAMVLEASSDNDPTRRAAALADLERSIKYEKQRHDPVLAQDHSQRGELFYLEERFEDALAESRLALEVKPAFVDAHVLQVRSLLKLGRFDEVMRSCDTAIKLGKKSAILHEIRGLANSARHDYPAAIRDYGEALELETRNSRLLDKRGWAYLMVESPRLALADFEAAIKIDPSDADACNGRGMALAHLGEHAAAVADAREALSHAGKDPLVYYRAARIYAVAAATTAREVGEKGRQARQLTARYEDTAVQLVRQAFEHQPPEKRVAFWHDTVQSDPAFKTIRRRIKFEDLIVTNK